MKFVFPCFSLSFVLFTNEQGVVSISVGMYFSQLHAYAYVLKDLGQSHYITCPHKSHLKSITYVCLCVKTRIQQITNQHLKYDFFFLKLNVFVEELSALLGIELALK